MERLCDTPGASLSQMSDAYTSTLILGCGIEVKASDGDCDEASMQLGVWCAAGLEKLRRLYPVKDDHDLRPLIGITVIGHDWNIHIGWKRVNGDGTTVNGTLLPQFEFR